MQFDTFGNEASLLKLGIIQDYKGLKADEKESEQGYLYINCDII